jgi:uncharacterized protein
MVKSSALTAIAARNDRPAHRLASCGIAVMAKASLAGRSKTRLVPPLTHLEAAAFNTAFIKDVADNVLAAARSAPIAGYMAYGPPGAAAFFRENVSPDFGIFEACSSNFGDCLYAAVCELLHRSHRAAIVLNSDSPTLPTALLVQAAELLAQPGDRAVLGPASDGGYYLLGLKQAHRRMFEEIDWSTEHVARQTIERAREIGLDLHVLPTWYDIDDLAALRMLHAELREGYSFDSSLRPNQATQTAALMESLLARSDLAARLGMAQDELPERMAV